MQTMNEIMPKKFIITINGTPVHETDERNLAMAVMMKTSSDHGMVELKENGVTISSKGTNEKPKSEHN